MQCKVMTYNIQSCNDFLTHTLGSQEKLAAYRKFLTLGGSMAPLDELKIAGVDMSTPQPVCEALDYFAERVYEYKQLLTEE